MNSIGSLEFQRLQDELNSLKPGLGTKKNVPVLQGHFFDSI